MKHEGLQAWSKNNDGDWTSSTQNKNQETTWPEKTHMYCFWCCHPFETRPVPLPVAYDDRKDAFKVIGNFCSWNCAKAYNISSNCYEWGYRSELLHMLYKRTEGSRATRIVAALPKARLKIFGGNLDIGDFRTLSGDAKCERPLFLRLEYARIQAIDGMRPLSTLEKTASDAASGPSKMLTFDNLSTGKNETLKLKRSKPLPTKTSNILEKVLGLDPSKASTLRGQK